MFDGRLSVQLMLHQDVCTVCRGDRLSRSGTFGSVSARRQKYGWRGPLSDVADEVQSLGIHGAGRCLQASVEVQCWEIRPSRRAQVDG